jgi:peroxiredoxin
MMRRIIRKIKSTRWLSIALQLLLVLVVYFAVRGWQLKDSTSGPAPIIAAQLMNGEAVNLRDYRGRPVLLHFWATWCPICTFENASIAAIAKDYQVLTIASWSEGQAEVQQFMQQQQLDMPVIIDEDGGWARLYGISGVPASFVIDEHGVIRFRETGFTSETGLRLRLWWLEN